MTEEDLRKAIATAYKHLKTGGVLLIVAHTREEFKENNFVYADSKGDVEVTIFENNRVVDAERSAYEATLVYLIRRKGQLTIHTDCHRLGLFPLATWMAFLKEAGLEMKQMKMDYSYDRFILGQGEYPIRVMMCVKG